MGENASTSSASSASYGPLPLSDIVLGGGVFGAAYNDAAYLESDNPAKVIKLAFENGVNAIDTSPFYGASESVIGAALASLDPAAFPRSSYHLITKCGRYGANKSSFDYSASRIRTSVQESLRRFRTDYLDAVYLHDAEFVADAAGKANVEGFPLEALANMEEYGLHDASSGRILGDGDKQVLEAYQVLLDFKRQGIIRRAGIAGYPLPTLLRLVKLIKARLDVPVDIVQTYSHYNLQNTTLEAYAPLFRKAGVQQVLNASPLNMGLLTTLGPQPWHLAPPSLRSACAAAAAELSSAHSTSLEAVANGFGLASTQHELGCNTVIGCSVPEHVEQVLSIWKALYTPLDGSSPHAAQEQASREASIAAQKHHEAAVKKLLKETGYLDWSWTSPPTFEEQERS